MIFLLYAIFIHTVHAWISRGQTTSMKTTWICKPRRLWWYTTNIDHVWIGKQKIWNSINRFCGAFYFWHKVRLSAGEVV